ncbi:hypothetical protein B296_00047300 [Ensete ventricosum]|uniref:Uncharacterized protein n=1 Tax=Ensete ventricosum TaxID=4639 RepID=A0A426Z077_ENSVE|nr:hypothetical protein B296_00047300 [Ensete ventricosum]
MRFVERRTHRNESTEELKYSNSSAADKPNSKDVHKHTVLSTLSMCKKKKEKKKKKPPQRVFPDSCYAKQRQLQFLAFLQRNLKLVASFSCFHL